jgi:hypothetical protein
MALPTYTAWPVASDVIKATGVMGFTLPVAADTDYVTEIVTGVASEVTRDCKRTFIKETATRYFDGSGTGEIEVDEYIDITSIDIKGYFGSIAGLGLTEWWEVQRNVSPKNRIQIYQGSTPSLTRIWISSFPPGRSNIAVTGDWGYGTTIPIDLWQAVKKYAAVLLGAEIMINGGKGFQLSWKEADVIEQYMLLDPSKFTKYRSILEKAIHRYKRPDSYQLRQQFRRSLV